MLHCDEASQSNYPKNSCSSNEVGGMVGAIRPLYERIGDAPKAQSYQKSAWPVEMV